ncbi:EamA family transporter [Clavibacter michiganensis]|nr:DMT family transporter [Clavibacter michiganensis]PPF56437.1 EamA family transporter [Clavibacter michiganensis]
MRFSRVAAALRPTRPELVLMAITALWGATFLVVHVAVTTTGPMFFVGLRFLAAAAICSLVFRSALRKIGRAELVAGTAIGAAIFLGYGLQTFGLQTVNSSTSAFITALCVPLVPLLQWAVLRRRPSGLALAGTGLAVIGLVFLAGPSAISVGLSVGEVATIASAFAFAAEVILIGAFAGRVNIAGTTIVQLFVAGALGLVAMPITGEQIPEFSWVWLGAAVFMAASSAAIQFGMNWAQRSVSPTRATIIYSGEPVWAGIVGAAAGERILITSIIGAAFIVAGVIVSELRRTPASEHAVEAGAHDASNDAATSIRSETAS